MTYRKGKIAVTSSGMLATPNLATLLGAEICRPPLFGRGNSIKAVAGWGMRPSGMRAEAIAKRLNVPVLHLEDGFLRSINPGRGSPPLSIIKDTEGIYYDSSRPSALERLLNSDANLLCGIESEVKQARQLINQHRLSKYNHAPDLSPGLLRMTDKHRVLVVDQTVGDNSVALGGANAGTFKLMVDAAIRENSDSTIYVKTHPEVSQGSKGGYLTDYEPPENVVMVRQPVNPVDLVLHMDRVYTVASTMGFEALLAGRSVTCLGIPWYAGWGVTDDRQTCARRNRHRSVEELFAAAYFHYTTYMNPRQNVIGNIFDVISFLAEKRKRS
ncbi:hypothetical protein ACQQ2Q_07895 [Agrobacterium sp. ES01]|uniref:capsular polysaccharide export protein, LipB/KpsS family n=1 Tax=Agrobacterium sp. ES01 TaxID=3420714 RepID=UPI003D0C3919